MHYLRILICEIFLFRQVESHQQHHKNENSRNPRSQQSNQMMEISREILQNKPRRKRKRLRPLMQLLNQRLMSPRFKPKKPVVLKVLAKSAAKIIPEHLESDKSSPEAEGTKVKESHLTFVSYLIPFPFDYSMCLNFLYRVARKVLGNQVLNKLFM